MTEEKKKTTGSKLSRSEVVTVRFDPKLRYLAELASRKHRRTLSSFIEWAVEHSLSSVNLYEGTGYNGDDSKNIGQESSELWDVDEAERFIKLAINYPDLLTIEEQERWKLLSDSELLAPAKKRIHARHVQWDLAILEDSVYPAVRRYWPEFEEAYRDGLDARRVWVERMIKLVRTKRIYPNYPSELNALEQKNSHHSDMDDDIPF